MPTNRPSARLPFATLNPIRSDIFPNTRSDSGMCSTRITLPCFFAEYNGNPAKYRVAVHPAAQWIRDELFRRALETRSTKGKNRVVFTAGGNASGKSTAISLDGSASDAQIVFDSTFSNARHARRLVDHALAAGKAITILYVNRPLDDALMGTIERAETEGRVVTIDQSIKTQQGAAETVRGLWKVFEGDPRFTFTFLLNSAEGMTSETGIEAAVPQDYTKNRRDLNELLDAAYQAGRIAESGYRRIGRRV